MKLLDKARTAVETLPSTLEGYNRVKSILQDLYGKEIEILKTRTSEKIFELSYIPAANPRKTHEFREKLTNNVQALQTLNKLTAKWEEQ